MKCVWLTEQVDNVRTHRPYIFKRNEINGKKKKRKEKGLQYISCESDIQMNLIEHLSSKKYSHNCSKSKFGKDDNERVSPYYYVIIYACIWICVCVAWKRLKSRVNDWRKLNARNVHVFDLNIVCVYVCVCIYVRAYLILLPLAAAHILHCMFLCGSHCATYYTYLFYLTLLHAQYSN